MNFDPLEYNEGMKIVSPIVGILTLAVLILLFMGEILRTECLCDGLPGGQCDYCSYDHSLLGDDLTDEEKVLLNTEYAKTFLEAWETEHTAQHQTWVEQHEEFHAVERTDDEHRTFHLQMEEAHRAFHQVFQDRLEELKKKEIHE